MITFDINGAIIKFDEQRDNYNTIRKIFLEYARKARKEFQEYCDENLTTFIENIFFQVIDAALTGGFDRNMLFFSDRCIEFLNKIGRAHV